MIAEQLKNKIQTNDITLGVIGLGYVGLPLACEFAHAGIPVIGFDIDQSKVTAIHNGTSYITDIQSEEVAERVASGKLRATTDFSLLKTVDVISICVPTPLNNTKDPEMAYIMSALSVISENLKKGQLIILESTTFPGTTDEIIQPELEKNGLKVGHDIFLAFSPERVDPGNAHYQTQNTPKVLGGVTPQCTALGKLFYEKAIQKIVTVSSPKAAELVKLLENTFRSINIGLANEMAIICNKLGIDVWEVINAAATKPFGFMPFYPGPGLGGHCIPIDPFYLSWKLRTLDYHARFIELAGQINRSMPHYVVSKIAEALNKNKKCVNGSKILLIGLSYKPNINDIRESPAVDIFKELHQQGAEVSFHDDLVKHATILNTQYTSVPLTKSQLSGQDIVIILANHSYLDKALIIQESKLIFDTRNFTQGTQSDHIIKL